MKTWKKNEPITKSNEDVSEEVIKTITETSNNNNKALENLNKKLLETVKDRGILASYLSSPLSKITNPEYTSQYKLVRVSNRVDDLLIHNTIPITLHDNLLTFRDTGKVFELKGDLLRMITNKKFNVDLASLEDKKFLHDIAKEMNFDLKALGNKSTHHRTLMKLFKSPAIMASGISKKILII